MAGARVAESLKSDERAPAKAQLDSTLRPVIAHSGLALTDVDEVVLGASQADQLLFVVRATQSVDPAAIRKNLGCTGAMQKIGQFDVFPLPGEPESAESVAAFVDAKTFLVGSKGLVQQALESSPGTAAPSVLKEVIGVAGAKTHLWVVARTGTLKPQVAQLTGFGVSESLFAPSLDKIHLVAMSFDLSKGVQVRVAMECKSEGEAKLMRGVVDSVRVALRDVEKKQAFVPGSAGSPGGGAPSGSPGRDSAAVSPGSGGTQIAMTIVDAFLDPMVPQRRWKGRPLEGVALTHYVGMGGVGDEAPRLAKEHPRSGIFGYNRKTALADVRDGASHTIMMIQVRDVFGPWIQGGGATVRAAQSQPYIGATSGFGSPGDTGVMTIFADGSVRFISKDVDPKVFEALCTMNGGETVDVAKYAPTIRSAPDAPAPAMSSIASTGANASPSTVLSTSTIPSASTIPGETEATPDVAVYKKPEDGFSIELPVMWNPVDMARLDDELRALRERHPQASPLAEPMLRTMAAAGTKFCGFDLSSAASGFAANVNVVKESLPGPVSLDFYVQQNLRLLESAPTIVKPIRNEPVMLGAGDAVRLNYSININLPTGANSTSITQYLIVKGTSAYVITFTSLSSDSSKHTSTFDKIAQSFRILN
jgi:hypothetical protein